MPNSIDPRLMLQDLKDLIAFKFEMLSDEIREVKNQMADLNQSVADLQVAVQGVADRVAQLTGPLQDQIAELQTTLQAERDAAAALAAAEDQEDVEQNQALADAQAATDAALQNASNSADSINAAVADLNNVAKPAPEPGGGA